MGSGLSHFSLRKRKKMPSVSVQQDMQTQLNLIQLRDELPIIFSALNLVDLCTVEMVCEDFHSTVQHVLRRRGPQIEIVDIAKPSTWGIPGPPIRLREKMRIKTRLILFFTNDKSRRGNLMYVNQDLCSNYDKCGYLPHDVSMISLRGYATILDSVDVDAEYNHGLGMFFPNNERIRLKYFALDDFQCLRTVEDDIPHIVKAVIGEIEGDHHNFAISGTRSSAYLLFNDLPNDSYPTVRKQERSFFIENLKFVRENYRKTKGKFAFLGCHLQGIYDLAALEDRQFWIGISISGPGVKSWSIPINMWQPTEVIEERLKTFKENIYFKGDENVAIAIISTNKKESLKSRLAKTAVFSRTFPDVRLMTFGIDETYPKYCVDSTSFEEEPRLVYPRNYVCYLVISC